MQLQVAEWAGCRAAVPAQLWDLPAATASERQGRASDPAAREQQHVPVVSSEGPCQSQAAWTGVRASVCGSSSLGLWDRDWGTRLGHLRGQPSLSVSPSWPGSSSWGRVCPVVALVTGAHPGGASLRGVPSS